MSDYQLDVSFFYVVSVFDALMSISNFDKIRPTVVIISFLTAS